jgi:hypothetical protein
MEDEMPAAVAAIVNDDEYRKRAYAEMLTEQALFMHVYRLPEKLNSGFCFGGGNPITFTNVDWFGGPAEMTREEIEKLIRKKRYCVPGHKYLVVSDTPERTFLFAVVAAIDDA